MLFGVVLLVVIAVIVAIKASQPAVRMRPELRFAVAHQLPLDPTAQKLIANHLERQGWYRRTGGWLGSMAGIGWSIAVGSPPVTLVPAIPAALAGSLLGMAIGESYRLRDLPAELRRASLRRRTLADYRPLGARLETPVLGAVILVFGTVTVWIMGWRHVGSRSAVVGLMLVGVAVCAFERALAWRIVRRGQPLVSEAVRLADDHGDVHGVLVSRVEGRDAASLDRSVVHFGTIGLPQLGFGVAGLVLASWVFGCWLSASRVAFDATVCPREVWAS